jgi:hypothetical protein
VKPETPTWGTWRETNEPEPEDQPQSPDLLHSRYAQGPPPPLFVHVPTPAPTKRRRKKVPPDRTS